MKDLLKDLDRITADPAVHGGRPVIRGTELTVNEVLRCLATHESVPAVLEAYPQLTAEDVEQAIRYAAARAAQLFGE